MKKLAILPFLLCFALAAQAMVAADHMHLNADTETNCSVCVNNTDLAPSTEFTATEIHQSFVFVPSEHVVAQRAIAIRQRSRAPPTQI